MTNIVQTTVSKAVVAFVAAAMIFTAFAAPARAQSVEDLQKMITELMAQIAALQAGSTPAPVGGNCAAIPAPLTMGDQNMNVTSLQNYLIAAGNAIPAGATGYFGTQTQSALAAWQAANGVSPAAGYYGPITAAAMAAKCVPVTTPVEEEDEDEDTSTPALEGGEGDIDVTDLLSSDTTIDLGSAEEVLSVEIEAIDSDVSINRVDYFFDARPWLYFDEVNLVVEGDVVATLDRSSDFTEVGSEWRARFSGLDLVVREDDIVEVTLELVALPSMSGTRDQDTVNVAMKADSARFVDAAGISETGGVAIDADVTFDDAFGEGEIRGSVSDSSPENATIVVEESSRTTGVEIAVIDAQARDADMEIKTVTAQLSVAGTGNTTGNVFYRAYLMDGDTELKRVSVSGTTAGPEVVTFNDVDFMVEEGDTAELSLVVDFNDGEDMGTTTNATFTVGNVVITAENPNFETDTETVSVAETHNIVQDGVVAVIDSMNVSRNNQVTTLTVKMDVTAYGEDFWISATTATALATNFTLPATTTLSVAPEIQISGVSKNGSGNFRIQDGQTRTLTATYTFTNGGTAVQFVTGNLATLTYGNSASTATGSTFTLGSPDFDLPTVEIGLPN